MKTRWALAAMVLFLVSPTARAAEGASMSDLIGKIDQMAKQGEAANPALGKAIKTDIEKTTAAASAALLTKLKEPGLTDEQRAVCIWAFAFTKDASASQTFIELHRKSKSEPVKMQCLNVLATLGGKASGDYLMSVLNATPDKAQRFNILNLLAQMQYEAAIPKTEELLQADPQKEGRQPVFVFGKMGDKAVPFLLTKIGDENKSVRINAITILGQWLIAPDAAAPLQERYGKEPEAVVRRLILVSMERIIGDPARQKEFFTKVLTSETDEKLIKYAKESIKMIDELPVSTADMMTKKQPSAASFKKEYLSLFDSFGKDGNYRTLLLASEEQDEPRLKALRERILQRNSDEAFGDYQKVNKMIIQNRMLKWLKKAAR